MAMGNWWQWDLDKQPRPLQAGDYDQPADHRVAAGGDRGLPDRRGERPQLLTRQPQRRPPRFSLRPDGSLAVDSIDALPAWTDRALSKLSELLELPENWNGYGARAVDPRVVPTVLNLLVEILATGDPPFPDLIPTVDGGVQMEWHTEALDFEIEVSPTNEVRAYYCDEEAGDEWEGELFSKTDDFVRAVSRLRDR